MNELLESPRGEEGEYPDHCTDRMAGVREHWTDRQWAGALEILDENDLTPDSP